MSKTQIIIHFVFGTKNRKRSISMLHRDEIYKYIYVVSQNLRCKVIRINGMSDHVHLLLELHPTIAPADLIKKIKQSSSFCMKGNPNHPMFEGWGKGYFAVSVSPEDKESCRQYIIQQEEHHAGKEYSEELQTLVQQHGMEWYEDEWI